MKIFKFLFLLFNYGVTRFYVKEQAIKKNDPFALEQAALESYLKNPISKKDE
jgi:hypothetical protein